MDKDLEYLLRTLLIENCGSVPENWLDVYLMDNIQAKDILVDLCVACGMILDENNNKEK